MANQFVPLAQIAAKVEADVLADLGSGLIPALLQEAVQFIPAAEQPIATAVLPALQAPLQQAFASLLAKIPAVPVT